MSEQPKRTRLVSGEPEALLKMVKDGVPWSKVRVSFPSVTPEFLDATRFDWARRRAGLPPAALPVDEPPVLEATPKAVPPKVRKPTK